MTFDTTEKLSDLTKNDAATNRSDKKRAQSVLEVGMLNQFLEMEPAQMNFQFPLSKLTQELEKELDQDFFHDDNSVREKLIPKKDINNNIERKV